MQDQGQSGAEAKGIGVKGEKRRSEHHPEKGKSKAYIHQRSRRTKCVSFLDSQALQLLELIVGQEGVSFYELLRQYAAQDRQREEDILEVFTKAAYALAGRGLVSFKVIDGDDGKETLVSPTDLGKNYQLSNDLFQ